MPGNSGEREASISQPFTSSRAWLMTLAMTSRAVVWGVDTHGDALSDVWRLVFMTQSPRSVEPRGEVGAEAIDYSSSTFLNTYIAMNSSTLGPSSLARMPGTFTTKPVV